MQTLTELSSAINFASDTASMASLDYAQRFTARFRKCELLAPAAREVELLALQFPACLQAPLDTDVYVGRILYPCVGFSPEPAGLGYYFDFAGVRRRLAAPGITPAETAAWQALIAFWEPRTTQAITRAAYPEPLARRMPSDAWTEESGAAFPLYRMAGTILDYATLLDLGLGGIERKITTAPDADSAFLQAGRAAVELFRRSLRHYCELPQTSASQRDVLAAIDSQPPQTFDQAVQLFWLWALHAGTWNYGRLDVILGPFLARDLDTGRLTEAMALDRLRSLWRLMHAYSNQYNNRIIVGGVGRADEAAADRFALLAIEATRRERLNQPQLSLRFHARQNPQLWERAIDAIAEGCTFPMLYNDEVNVPSVLAAFGVTLELAEQYTPYGCGEYVLSHYSVGTPNGVINLLKCLEVALHAGHDPFTGQRVIDSLPSASALTTFEDLWNAYTHVVEIYTSALAQQQKLEYEVTGREGAFVFASLLLDDCISRGTGAFSGGIHHLGGTLETYGNSNTADALQVINQLVYNSSTIDLPALVAALDSNFVDAEPLRQQCLRTLKYGNDEALADAMAVRVHEHICRFTRAQAAAVGLNSYLVVNINNWANTVLGKFTGASAEGRLSGKPLANGNNPTHGADISGITAFLNSLAKPDPSLHAGSVQNMKFSKDWFRPDTRPKFDALLRAYFARGGTQAMITVVSRDDMEEAMREPHNWGHLMVRVGGFSIRFVELPHDAQLELLARTLY